MRSREAWDAGGEESTKMRCGRVQRAAALGLYHRYAAILPQSGE